RLENDLQRIINAAGKMDDLLHDLLELSRIGRLLNTFSCFSMSKLAIEGTLPDLTIFVNVRPEVGLKRVFQTPNREVNRLDLEDMSFHKMIYQGYLELMKKYSRIQMVNGEQEISKVTLEAINLIDKIL
ncbi:MAG: dTMP kinase, partial [Tenericutes bacterium HGW-Tenericutes-5]